MIGIVSCYFKINYGSMLQSFATQVVLDKLSIENETILIDGIKHEISRDRRKYYLRNLFNLQMYLAKKGFVRHLVQKKLDPKGFGANIAVRQRAFKRFEKECFRLSQLYTSKNQLSEACKTYSGVLLGSDQLWLPINIAGDYCTLNFVPKNVNKIAYATSFGIKDIPVYQYESARCFLNRFEHLSVRERSGQDIIRKLTARNVPVVCDPSLLLTREEWLLLTSFQKNIKKPYIFCYFLGNNKAHRVFANKLKEMTKYSIVVLRHLDEYIPSDDAFGDVAPYDVTPLDFINIIANAEYVCTDSFHGSAFSILMNKSFYAFRRFGQATSQSTNGRVEDLLTKLSLEDRMISGAENPCDIRQEIDYTEVMRKLDVWRTESMDYLTTALHATGECI